MENIGWIKTNTEDKGVYYDAPDKIFINGKCVIKSDFIKDLESAIDITSMTFPNFVEILPF